MLPTSGAARIRGGLSSADFVKVISVQELTHDALRSLAPAITTLARAEGLEAHARSVEVRLALEQIESAARRAAAARSGAAHGAVFAAHRRTRGKLRLDFNENTVGASPR